MSRHERNGAPRTLWAALLILAIASLVAELFVHHHAAFGIDGSYGFYAWYTVAVGIAGVALARGVALVLGRPEDDDA